MPHSVCRSHDRHRSHNSRDYDSHPPQPPEEIEYIEIQDGDGMFTYCSRSLLYINDYSGLRTVLDLCCLSCLPLPDVVEINDGDDEPSAEVDMMKLMGFSGFDSTKVS